MSLETKPDTDSNRISSRDALSEKSPEKSSEKPPVIPKKGIYNEEARKERLDFLRREAGVPLKSLEVTRLKSEALQGNIESFIGAVEIPVGVAGPLLIHSSEGSENIYAPIATTEGALVASIIRGAKAISMSGGVTVRALHQRMSRAPIFEFETLVQAISFVDWIKSHFSEIHDRAKDFSNFADLIDIEPRILGKTVHLIFIYETGDAAGQNMTTHCTWNTCLWIVKKSKEENLGIYEFHLEGNLSSDKKSSLGSILRGRGTLVIAECVIKRDILKRILKIDPDDILALYERGKSATLYSGMTGFNINVANVVAGIFAATGQDIACVQESSNAQVHLERKGEDLYLSLTMPNLVVGTVGGGVNLPAQSDLLELMGCKGKNKSKKLAEVIAGFALALDLSTMSAIAGGQFASAHQKLGRRQERNWLKKAQLDLPFFEEILQKTYGPQVHVKSVQPLKNFPMGDSLLLDLSSRVTRRLCGLMPFSIIWTDEKADEKGQPQETRLLLKLKALDEEVLEATEMLAAPLGKNIATLFNQFSDMSSFYKCHTRELEICRIQAPHFTSIAPKVFDVIEDRDREIFMIAEELLENLGLMNSADDISAWRPQHILAALKGISGFHSLSYGKYTIQNAPPWLGHVHSAQTVAAMSELWMALAEHARDEFPDWFTHNDFKHHIEIIKAIPDWRGSLDQMKKSLIHHDFNPRNMAFRNIGQAPQLCAYDWELATLHIPQHDLAELLSFTLTPKVTKIEVDFFIEAHRQFLEESTGQIIGPEEWRQGYKCALYDYLIQRVPMYIVAHTHKHCAFIERVYKTLKHLIEIEEKI